MTPSQAPQKRGQHDDLVEVLALVKKVCTLAMQNSLQEEVQVKALVSEHVSPEAECYVTVEMFFPTWDMWLLTTLLK